MNPSIYVLRPNARVEHIEERELRERKGVKWDRPEAGRERDECREVEGRAEKERYKVGINGHRVGQIFGHGHHPCF